VGILKVLTVLPPVKVTVNVKLTGLPQTNPGPVLKEYGTRLVPSASIGRSAYGECDCVTVTPGVDVLRVVVMFLAGAQPMLSTFTVKELHSFGSIMPLPLPAATTT